MTTNRRPKPGRLAIEPLEPRLLLAGGPLITEFMADNGSTILDGDGFASDWIEIYNPTDSAIPLAGWYLSDKTGNPDKWQFPADQGIDTTLDPGEYMLVFASGKSNSLYPYVDDGGYLHTNFKLDADGENVLLVEDDGQTIAHGYIDYPEQGEDVSYGIYMGQTWQTLVDVGADLSFYVPTPADGDLLPSPDDAGWAAADFDDSSWTRWIIDGAADVLIMEVDTGETRFVEIQNCSRDTVATAGWRVLVNDAGGPVFDINDVNSTAWDLPVSMVPGEIAYRTNRAADNYWGSDISWTIDGPGWVMIVDAGGNVMDFLAWGYTESQIDSLDVSYGGLTGITVGDQWSGDGALTGLLVPEREGQSEGGTISYAGGTYSENFNSMGSSGTTPPTGWSAGRYAAPQVQQPPGSVVEGESLMASDGSSKTRDVSYNYGSTGSGDRAIGNLTHSSDRGVQLAITNDTGSEITEITLGYTGEQWRQWTGGVVPPEKLGVWFRGSIDADSVYMGAEFDFEAPQNDGAGLGGRALNGNSSANRTQISGTFFPPEPIPDGETFYIIWHDWEDASFDHGMAVDDVVFSAYYGPNDALKRVGNEDGNSAADFRRNNYPSAGAQNPDAIVPFGVVIPNTTGAGFADESSQLQSLIHTNVGAAMQGENASLWSRIAFNVDPPGDFDTITLWMKYNDGFVAYLNGQKIADSNAPDSLQWNSTARSPRSVENSFEFEEFAASAAVDAIRPGENVLAIHGLNVTAADDDFLLLPKLAGANSWGDQQSFASPTPGSSNSPQRVVINEINYDPENNADPIEFIELYNATESPIDISGWYFDDGIELTIPEDTEIPGGGYVVVAANPIRVQGEYDVEAIGPWTGRLDNDGEQIVLRNANGQKEDEVDYRSSFPWPIAARGDGSSIELIHPELDNNLGGNWRPSGYDTLSRAGEEIAAAEARPTPGEQNSVWSTQAAPTIREVQHENSQPAAGEPVAITARIGDPQGVEQVNLLYQLVLPGSYIPAYLPLSSAEMRSNPTQPRLPNPAFEDAANWTAVAMTDDGTGNDATAHDGIYTATLPGQPANRTLVRYRISATDRDGNSATAPYLDDPSLNFAYYVYDGVPDYTAETNSIQGAGSVYDSDTLTSLPVYSLIARPEDIVQMMAYDSADQVPQSGDQAMRRVYNWNAAFVYDGVVYDHVDMRLRGANGRYHYAGKRSMRIRFNPGYYLQARDHNGEEYPTKWRQLVVGKMFGNRGDYNWGVSEALNNEFWRLVGVPAPYTHWFHFRVVDGAEEAPAGANSQYFGDFWGMFMAFEPYDVRFLEAHDMEKGNLYKLVNSVTDGKLQQRYQAPDAVSNAEDFNNIRSNLNASRDATWLQTYVNYDEWYRYHAVAEAIKHYDYWPGANKNVAWYFEPDDPNPLGQFWYLPYDSDASWGPTWNGGEDEAKVAIYGGGGQPAMKQEYRNTIREIRDLIFQPDVIGPWIDRVAEPVQDFWQADYDRWEDAPPEAGRHDMNSNTLPWKVADMKNFAFVGGNWPGGSVMGGGQAAYLDQLANAEGDGGSIPGTPTITYAGPAAYPIDELSFRTSAFTDPQGAGTFHKMEWRVGEITDPSAPAYDPDAPWKFEYAAQWESGELATFDDTIAVPGGSLEVGHTYRARVRMKDYTGRWGHWSAPVEFTAGEALGQKFGDLRITEVMYRPADPTPEELAQMPGLAADDFEFIELHNSGGEALDLTGVHFSDGILFDFSGSPAADLQPDQYVVVARNPAAFALRYNGVSNVVGPFGTSEGSQTASRLNDAGEGLALAEAGGLAIIEFEYDTGGNWPGRADGKGASLVLIDPAGVPSMGQEQIDYLEDGDNWRSSVEYGGSPGWAGAEPGADVVVNEVLSHTDPPQFDSIELHNTTGSEIDISGWYLSDSWGWQSNSNNGNYKKFRIPDDTRIEAYGYRVFDENDFNSSGGVDPADFALDGAHGDDVWLMKAEANGRLTHFVDHVEFGGAANGEPFGRWPSAGDELYPMFEDTLENANTGPRVGPLIISEVMYDPADPDGDGPIEAADLEFIELYNPTGRTINLAEWLDNPHDQTQYLADWRLRDGVDMEFDEGTTIAAGETLVVLSFNPTRPENIGRVIAFRNSYGIDHTVKLVGGYNGSLNNGGERVRLQRPDSPPPDETDFVPHLLEDEVDYAAAAPWPAAVDGDSLHRERADLWGNDHDSWISAPATPGSVSFAAPPPAEVVGRYVFYNNSAFDGYTPGTDLADDGAVAPDPGTAGDAAWGKTALLPGETAGFQNYTSFKYGVNGIMVDVENLPQGVTELDGNDFSFKAGNSSDPDSWTEEPVPLSIDLRTSYGRPARVTIIFDDGLIVDKWLQVTVETTARTGLSNEDVFYFGNGVGEIGDDGRDALVTYSDLIQTRDNINLTADVPIENAYDVNRDGYVDYSDLILCRNSIDADVGLELITVPALTPLEPEAVFRASALPPLDPEGVFQPGELHDTALRELAASDSTVTDLSLAELMWLFDQQPPSASGRSSGQDKTDHSTVDKILATYQE